MVNLWSHQEQIVSFMRGREYGLINAGMGTGKTLSALTYIERSKFGRVLVVTKQKAIDVWFDEWKKFGFAAAGDMILVKAGEGSVKKAADDLSKCLQLQAMDRFALVIVVNYERIWRDPLYVLLATAGFDAIILDESHKAKSHNGNASNALFTLAQRIPHRFCMTGTPMPNGPMDLYGQWRILNPALVRVDPAHKGFGIFREYYCYLEPVRGAAPGIVKITGYKNTEQFNRIMQATTLQIKTEDVLDLPPEQHITRHVTLGAEAKRLYKELNKEYIAEVGSGIITISNVLVKTLRLHQLTGGFIKPDRANSSTQVDEAKIADVLDILDSLPATEPVVIFCKYTDEITSLTWQLATAGYTVSALSGTKNQLQNWKDGKTQIIIVQIDTGAEGISLVRAKYAIYYSLGYSLGQYEQSLARLRRPGQMSDRVFYYHIVAKGTIDDVIYQALRDKKEVTSAILDALSEGNGERLHIPTVQQTL